MRTIKIENIFEQNPIYFCTRKSREKQERSVISYMEEINKNGNSVTNTLERCGARLIEDYKNFNFYVLIKTHFTSTIILQRKDILWTMEPYKTIASLSEWKIEKIIDGKESKIECYGILKIKNFQDLPKLFGLTWNSIKIAYLMTEKISSDEKMQAWFSGFSHGNNFYGINFQYLIPEIPEFYIIRPYGEIDTPEASVDLFLPEKK